MFIKFNDILININYIKLVYCCSSNDYDRWYICIKIHESIDNGFTIQKEAFLNREERDTAFAELEKKFLGES